MSAARYDTRREGLIEALRSAADEMHRLRQRKDARLLREHAADLEALRDAENLGAFFEAECRIIDRLTHGEERDG